MEATSHAFGYEATHRLFTRDGCVICPEENPSCPTSCPSGHVCSIVSANCNACAFSTCVPNSVAGGGNSNPSSSGGTNVGAIAGGVVGGVAFIAILVFAVWWFFIRGKRQQWEEEQWEEEEQQQQQEDQQTEKTGPRSTFAMHPGPRASTHTIGSIASTVFTRASNIIQIAYIPGVTNRDHNGTPSVLVPPVPPIPAMNGVGSPHQRDGEHYFLPSDLRDTMYSANNEDARSLRSTRSTRLRQSITPSLARGSFAPSVYQDNVVISPMPAQTVLRGKAAMVSVKSSQNNSPLGTPNTEGAPPVPSISAARLKNQKSNSSLGSAGSTPNTLSRDTSNASTVARPVPLNIAKMRAANRASNRSSPLSTPRVASTISSPEASDAETIRPAATSNAPSMRRVMGGFHAADDNGRHSRANRDTSYTTSTLDTDASSDDDEDPHARSRRSLIGRHPDDPDSPDSPFSDIGADRSLNAVIQEATQSASLLPRHGGFGSTGRTESPFDDRHAT